MQTGQFHVFALQTMPSPELKRRIASKLLLKVALKRPYVR